mmetsp:Transcript_59064/g.188633  ORF Transcript_59064/g.188633 Transcript_59064/m.188633 type:complete len:88 (-) Transcript_59064:101-364(-)|eukprot:CAMPEP_0182865962 /NCGR_PEP_ID=MMETSP0034_2-20130328/7965_1 /TAXON_ID=156128 /ORGANISM="Nephroselmis pyriformis, Strain CCMP717" /LENGTH=87 /DNA_ID=CAMNT_0024998285 /DNA_START=91 /DNA_END=354 /DNA_ORIENTATION=-
MDLTQQVKNSLATIAMSKPSKKGGLISQAPPSHRGALQQLSNQRPVAYSSTLLKVEHFEHTGPVQEEQQTRKHPGYIRNEFGGFFTS